MADQFSAALTELILRRLTKQQSRAPNVAFTNPRGRRDTAEEDSAGAVIGSMTEVDASSCLESTEIEYTPPTT
ncbi:hypothetical protein HB770_04055 [Rhizobium leguminosarum bv. viciae]|uniref:Uncharacterized protein n=1 Tax=Rhizobium leguminosarum bv. viciae TaxID=387 RepID=A0A7G6RHT7_RHILV|nr:hypothetical protein HB770_04055 [Rhizobium leguminosarum bv. viciae]